MSKIRLVGTLRVGRSKVSLDTTAQGTPETPVAIQGLDYDKLNGEGGADIRLIWDAGNLLPRIGHTAIWRFYPRQQTGYHAVGWHSPNNGVDTWDSGVYSYGTHPYPTDGNVDGTGNSSGTGSAGEVHYWEEAGLGDGTFPHDFIASPGESGLQVVKNQWYVQVRKCRQIVGGGEDGQYEHVFIPDLLGTPSFRIRQVIPSIGSGGAHPAFYFGASDWRQGYGGATTTDEALGGIIRGIQLYNAYLSDGDHATEAANHVYNTPRTSAGLSSVWYMNQSPTPSDVTDKSGAGHNPRWDNANRPVLYSE